MKKKLLKTFFLAVGLLVGGSAWAETTTVGKTDNTTEWWSAFSDYYTLNANQTLTINFTNYTGKADNAHNWVACLTTDADRNDTENGYSEYVVLRADNYGWGGVYDSKCLSSYYNWDTFKNDMDGANVTMTVKRVGSMVTIYADITASDGTTKYWEKLTANCGSGAQNIRFFLTTEGGHLTDITSTTTSTSIEQHTVKTWDFTNSTSENASITSSANGTVTITVGSRRNSVCYLSNTGILTEGLYFWDSWKLYKGYFQNISSGDRVMVIPNLQQGDVITFTSDADVIVATSNSIYTAHDGTSYTISANADGNVGIGVNKNKKIYKITVNRIVETGAASEPTGTITGASGTSRKFTLASQTDGATIYYATAKKTIGSSEWTTYSSEVTTDASVIYTYAVKEGKASSINTFETGTGTTISLNAPTINRTGSTSVTITDDQSDKLGTPSTKYYYRIGNSGDFTLYSSAITVSSTSTVYAYAAAEGYDNSSTAERVVGFVSTLPQTETVSRITGYKSGALDTSESAAQTGGTMTTYYPLVIDEKQWGNNIYFQNAGWGFRPNGTWYNNGASSTNSWLLIKDMSKDDIIVIRITEGALALVNATYSEEYSYTGHYAYTVDVDGDVEMRFQRTSDKKNNELSGIDTYSTKVSVPVGTAGFATYANHDYALDFTNVSGLVAFTATVSGDEVTFTPATQVPAGTGLLLKGATADVPVIATAAAIDDNVLYAPTTAVSGLNYDQDNYYNYILSQPSGKAIGFYRANNNNVAVGKAYLRIAKGDGARQFTFIGLDGDATGIETIGTEAQTNGEVYNLSGQRVAQPARGLFIMNGKKVVIK